MQFYARHDRSRAAEKLADNLARLPRALANSSKFCRVDRLVIVVGDPLCIARELGETSFEALIFAHLVGPFAVFTNLTYMLAAAKGALRSRGADSRPSRGTTRITCATDGRELKSETE